MQRKKKCSQYCTKVQVCALSLSVNGNHKILYDGWGTVRKCRLRTGGRTGEEELMAAIRVGENVPTGSEKTT